MYRKYLIKLLSSAHNNHYFREVRMNISNMIFRCKTFMILIIPNAHELIKSFGIDEHIKLLLHSVASMHKFVKCIQTQTCARGCFIFDFILLKTFYESLFLSIQSFIRRNAYGIAVAAVFSGSYLWLSLISLYFWILYNLQMRSNN